MKKRLSALAALSVGATCLFTPTAAQAAEANHCWTKVATGETKCFTTFSAVVADLSGGQVRVSGGPASFSASDATAVAVASSSVTAAIAYDLVSYGPGSVTYVVPSACDSDPGTEYTANLVGSVWNDRISSFKSYNACQTKLWTNTFAGSSYGPVGTASSVGVLDNEASSIEWS